MLHVLHQISLDPSPLISSNSVTSTITLFRLPNSSLSYSRMCHLHKLPNSDIHQNIPVSGLIITTPAFPQRPRSLWPSFTLYSVYRLYLSLHLTYTQKSSHIFIFTNTPLKSILTDYIMICIYNDYIQPHALTNVYILKCLNQSN